MMGSGGDIQAGDNIYSVVLPFLETETGKVGLQLTATFGSVEFKTDPFALEVVPETVPVAIKPSDTTNVVVDPTTGAEIIANEVVIYTHPDVPFQTVVALAAQVNGTIIGRIPQIGAWQVQIPEASNIQTIEKTISTLLANSLILYAEPNIVYHGAGVVPNDPAFTGVSQYGLTRIRADEAWFLTTGSFISIKGEFAISTSFVIGIVDSGLDLTHPDLNGTILLGVPKIVPGSEEDTDKTGHGTSVAGVAAALSNNNDDVAGVCWDCRLLGIKVLSGPFPGSGSDLKVKEGIIKAVDMGAKIINLSLGGSGQLPSTAEALNYATQRNRLVVAAAMNDNCSNKYYPAGYTAAIAVGATDQQDKRAIWISSKPQCTKNTGSNFGPWVDLAAPGTAIATTVLGSPNFGFFNGTSFAAPFVSGAAGLLWAKHPEFTAAQIRGRIESTAGSVGQGLGHGLIDVFEAIFNGGFETGNLSEWQPSGTVKVLKDLGPFTPTQGEFMAMISTGPGGPAVASTFNHVFKFSGASLPPKEMLTITFDYNFITEEFPEFVGTIFNDFFEAKIVTPTGTIIPLAFESVNSSTFVPVSGIDFPGGDTTVGATGWKTASATVKLSPGTETITLFITDQGDAIFDSVALIDNVRFQ